MSFSFSSNILQNKLQLLKSLKLRKYPLTNSSTFSPPYGSQDLNGSRSINDAVQQLNFRTKQILPSKDYEESYIFFL